jgi:phosphohistidine phosphatase SixA
VRWLELRRHAPRDPEADRLSEQGRALALHVGKDLPGGYAAIYTSPAKRAAETVAWFLRGLGQQLPQQHGVVEGLAEDDDARLADTVRDLITGLPDGARGLAVGHTPLIERAVQAVTGQEVAPLRECEGVVVEEEDGEIRVAREYRRE